MTDYPVLVQTQMPDWNVIAQQTLHERQEPLAELPPHPKLKPIPVYFQQRLDGAVDAVVVRRGVAERLCRAAGKLPENIGIALFDGWRPLRVQRALRESMRVQVLARHPHAGRQRLESLLDEFVANPDRKGMCPPHLTGGSVDVGLFDIRTGEVLDMGSAFDETVHLSHTAALEDETDSRFKLARLHRRMLVAVMCGVGFSNLPSEWWHFDYGNQNWAYFTGAPFAFYGAANWEKAA